MWQNVRYYVLAYAIVVAGALVSSAFQLLGDQFPVGHPISTVSANLSGVTIGGLFIVMGFLKDSRVEEERKRTEEERKRAAAAEARADAAEARIQQMREQAEAADARAERIREQADNLMERYQAATESLIRRLEELNENGRSA